MKRGLIKRIIITLCLSLMLCMPVVAKDTSGDNKSEQKQEIAEEDKDDDENNTVNISDEKVPLGLNSIDDFERYKRAVVVMLVFGGMVVIITIGATIKEKYERNKYN